MSVYLDTSGRSTLGVGLCARCSTKVCLDELEPDATYSGLLCCAECRDEYDPYLLPPREPEGITLRFVRPDTPLTTTTVDPGTPAWPVPPANLQD